MNICKRYMVLMGLGIVLIGMPRLAEAKQGNTFTSAGPRFGLVYIKSQILRDAIQETLKEGGASNPGFLTAFGWQFEWEYMNSGAGTTGLIEFVPLVVGMESGLYVPSLSTILGVRFSNGFEIGFGPNFGPEIAKVISLDELGNEEISYNTSIGVGMVAAIGMTTRVGQMNFPFNLAALRNKNGLRVSLLVGWTL